MSKNINHIFSKPLAAFLLATRGAKEKLTKENAVCKGAAPAPRELPQKLDQNFLGRLHQSFPFLKSF
jgi:hypothetical protein